MRNLIHACALMRMFRKEGIVHFSIDQWALSGEKSFADFVNKNCDHLIITEANSIRVNSGFVQSCVKFQKDARAI